MTTPKQFAIDEICSDRAAGWRQFRDASRCPTLISKQTLAGPGPLEAVIISQPADVAAALRNPELRAYTGGATSTDPQQPEYVTFLAAFRKVLRRAITEGTPTWIERFSDSAAALIDHATRTGGCDVMETVAWPLAGSLFSVMCGTTIDDECPDGNLDIPGLITRARAHGGDDLPSLILAEAPQLSDIEIGLLVSGAWRGTRLGIAQTFGFVLLHLACNQSHQRQLRENPDRIGALVEEIVRLESTAPTFPKYAARDTVINGLPIRAGTWVLVCVGAANREGPDGDAVSLQRSRPGRHYGFSGGRWLCPGIHVARTALRVAVEQWLRAVPDFTLEPGHTPRIWGPGATFGCWALRALPIRWAAGAGQ